VSSTPETAGVEAISFIERMAAAGVGDCRRDGGRAAELTQLFRRWAGLTPKAFLQAVTLDHARRLLDASASVLEPPMRSGLSGPGRLHDLFVTHEAMSPGEYKSGGAGLTIRYGFHPSPFGLALVMANERGLCGLAFADADRRRPMRGLTPGTRAPRAPPLASAARPRWPIWPSLAARAHGRGCRLHRAAMRRASSSPD
jgi:AraC-like DNA-binding protein